jgi:hypothetical protein
MYLLTILIGLNKIGRLITGCRLHAVPSLEDAINVNLDCLSRGGQVDANDLERTRRKVKRHTNVTFQDVASKAEELRGVPEATLSSEKRDALMAIIREEEMEESTSSESEDDEDSEDLSGRVEGKKQKLDKENTESVTNGVTSGKTQPSRKAGLFEGGSSFW